MTPEQLKALMEWVDARIRQEANVRGDLAEMSRVGAIRRDLLAAFGFGEDNHGNPVVRETEGHCQMCGRNYAPGEEYTHGCGGPSSDVGDAVIITNAEAEFVRRCIENAHDPVNVKDDELMRSFLRKLGGRG